MLEGEHRSNDLVPAELVYFQLIRSRKHKGLKMLQFAAGNSSLSPARARACRHICEVSETNVSLSILLECEVDLFTKFGGVSADSNFFQDLGCGVGHAYGEQWYTESNRTGSYECVVVPRSITIWHEYVLIAR